MKCPIKLIRIQETPFGRVLDIKEKSLSLGHSMKKLVILLALAACKPHELSLSAVSSKPDAPYNTSSIVRTTNADVDKLLDMSYREDVIFQVGDRNVGISTFQRGLGLTFINLHDDENTSVKAVLEVIDSLGGKLIQLIHSDERNIRFNIGSQFFEFDPNRMFTDVGAEKTLSQFGPYNEKARKEVRALARRITSELDGDIILTLHNNTEDNYSAKSYLNEYANDAADIYLNPEKDPDDFFFVTERLFFDKIRELGYNVVLQNNETMTDDGSLSVWAGRENIPYINIEAQHGHTAEQVEMLFVVYQLFYQ